MKLSIKNNSPGEFIRKNNPPMHMRRCLLSNCGTFVARPHILPPFVICLPPSISDRFKVVQCMCLCKDLPLDFHFQITPMKELKDSEVGLIIHFHNTCQLIFLCSPFQSHLVYRFYK